MSSIIDRVGDCLSEWMARSQLAEADRLDAQAEALRKRAGHLRDMAAAHIELLELVKT